MVYEGNAAWHGPFADREACSLMSPLANVIRVSGLEDLSSPVSGFVQSCMKTVLLFVFTLFHYHDFCARTGPGVSLMRFVWIMPKSTSD